MNSGGTPSYGSTLASFAKKEEADKKPKGATGEASPVEGTARTNKLYSSLIEPASGPTSFSGGLSQEAAAFLEASKASIAPQESADGIKLAVRGSSSEEAKIPTMSFPQRLFEILAKEEHSDIISWLPHGLGFRIIHKKRFAAEVMPRYFKQSKFTSFTRKLKRWNFSRVTRGAETGSYSHPFFKRGDLSLCMQMTCSKVAAKVPNDGGKPLNSNPLVHSELQTTRQLEQWRTELLLRKHQSSFEAHLRTSRQAADTQALVAATTQRNNTSSYLAMLWGQHHAQMNTLEEIRRQQASMFLQQQQIVPYAQHHQLITLAQQLAAAAQQQQEPRGADEARGSNQHQERK